MPIILLLFPNTSSLIINFPCCIFNFFMYAYGQLSAIKDDRFIYIINTIMYLMNQYHFSFNFVAKLFENISIFNFFMYAYGQLSTIKDNQFIYIINTIMYLMNQYCFSFNFVAKYTYTNFNEK